MIIQCDYCKSDFYKRPSRIAKCKNNCCSKDCANAIKGSLLLKCKKCNKSFKRGYQQVKKSKDFYCSKKCLFEYIAEQKKNSESKRIVSCVNCNLKHIKPYTQIKKNITGIFYCSRKCRADYLRKKVIVKCIICGSDFYKTSAEQKRHPNHCCSIECRSIFNTKIVSTQCTYCLKNIDRPPSLLKNKNDIFCSKECHDKFQTTKQKIICDKCGKEFEKHICLINRSRHNFCSMECNSKYKFQDSFVEKEFEILLKDLGVSYMRNDRTIIKPLELDFYLPDLKYAVEVNGSLHYKPIYGEENLACQKIRDRRKRKLCKELGITLRIVKPGNCKTETYTPRYKRVIWEIKQLIKEKI